MLLAEGPKSNLMHLRMPICDVYNRPNSEFNNMLVRSFLRRYFVYNYLHLTEGPKSNLMHVRVPHDDVSNRPDA
jgi:hypothetical protein